MGGDTRNRKKIVTVRPVRILLAAVAPIAAGLTGWALGARDGYMVRWRHQDQPLLAHLTVRATGPGGTAEKVVGYHADPVAQP